MFNRHDSCQESHQQTDLPVQGVIAARVHAKNKKEIPIRVLNINSIPVRLYAKNYRENEFVATDNGLEPQSDRSDPLTIAQAVPPAPPSYRTCSKKEITKLS